MFYFNHKPYMAKKPMGIIKRIQKYLNEGYEVILKKDSDGAHQVSYSRVTRIEGTHLRRTMFEALSVAETYDYEVGKYTTQGIEENDRVSFFGKGKALQRLATTSERNFMEEDEDEDFDRIDDDDDDDDCDCCLDNISYDEIESIPQHKSLRHGRLKRIVL